MAKFANVTFGTSDDGTKKQYIYVVNDSVRVGTVIQPTVKHAVSGKLFATTGVIRGTGKNIDKLAPDARQELNDKGYGKLDNANSSDVIDVLQEKNIGIKRSRVSKARAARTGEKAGTYEGNTHDNEGNYILATSSQATRGANLEMRIAAERQLHPETPVEVADTQKQETAFKTYDDYIKKYGNLNPYGQTVETR